MDGVLIIPDEPLIASADATGPMPDDSMPSPRRKKKRSKPDANAVIPHLESAPLPEEAAGSDSQSCIGSDGLHGNADVAPADAERATDNQQLTTDNQAPATDVVEIVPMRVVEAIIFAADAALPANKIASILGVGDSRDVRKHIAALNELYTTAGNAFRIEEVAGGFRIMTLPAYNRWLSKLQRVRQETKLTGAAMETLAIVAYKQPCTRADIEAVRGVAAGDVLNRLREMNMIKIVGRAEDLGRPLLYGTTKRFLEVFGLAGLEDLPQVDALRGGAAAAPTPAESSAEAVESVEQVDAAPLRIDTNDFDMHEGGVPGSGSAEQLHMDQSIETPPALQLPLEASADLAAPEGHAGEHPPPKAVVTPRKSRARKPKDEPPLE